MEKQKSKNMFLTEDGLIVKSTAKPTSTKTFKYKDDDEVEQERSYGIYDIRDTRPVKAGFEAHAAYFYCKLYSAFDKTKPTFIKPKEEIQIRRTRKHIEDELKKVGISESRRNYLKKIYNNPLIAIEALSKFDDPFCWRTSFYGFSFDQFKSFLRGSGESISLVPKYKSHYFKLDFDYHRKDSEYYDEKKIFYEYKTIKRYLKKSCPKDFKYLIAIRPNLTGMHVYFWSDTAIQLNRGYKILQKIKIEAGLDPAIEIRPFEDTNDRIPFDPDYKIISDFIRDMNISYAYSILIEGKKYKPIADKIFQDYFGLPDLIGYKKEYQKAYIGKTTKSNHEEIYNVKIYQSQQKHKNRYWFNHCNFIHGSEKHNYFFTLQEFLRDLMVFTVHRYDKKELINRVITLLDCIDKKRTVSSYFNLRSNHKKYKYIEDYYNRVIRQKSFHDIVQSEMIVERVLERFQDTGRDLLCSESTKNYKTFEIIVPDLDLKNDEIHSFVLSDEEKEKIDSVLTPLLPKKVKNIAYKIALLIPKFANIQSNAGLAISYSYWNKLFSVNFGWNPGKNLELKNILESLIRIRYLKRCSKANNGSYNYDVGKKYPCQAVAANNNDEIVRFNSKITIEIPEVEDYESQMQRLIQNSV